jgi:hypothetical protein
MTVTRMFHPLKAVEIDLRYLVAGRCLRTSFVRDKLKGMTNQLAAVQQ